MIKTTTKRIDDVEIPIVEVDFVDANILTVTIGTNGFKGGNASHGSKTFFRLHDASATDIEINPIQRGVEITLKGDTELATFLSALKFAVNKLEACIELTKEEGDNE